MQLLCRPAFGYWHSVVGIKVHDIGRKSFSINSPQESGRDKFANRKII